MIQGLVDVRPLITHEFSLGDIARVFETASTDPGAIKVVVRPWCLVAALLDICGDISACA